MLPHACYALNVRALEFLSFSCALVKRFQARARAVLRGIAQIKKTYIYWCAAQAQQGNIDPKLNR